MENQVFLDFKLRFNLRQTKVNKPTIIYAVYYWKGIQYKINTGVKVYPTHWDKTSQTATVSNRLSLLDNKNNQIVNEKITTILISFNQKIKYLCNQNSIDSIFEELSLSINPNLRHKTIIKKMKITSLLIDMAYKHQSEKTSEQSAFIVKKFKEYLDNNKIADDISLLNGLLLMNYQQFLVNNKKTIKTIENYIRGLKTLINYANKDKTINIKIDISDLVVIKDKRSREQKKSKNVPLTEEELLKIYALNNLSEKEIEARDLFICQSLLGQRISDMPKIFKGDYTTNKFEEGNETISFNVQKTGEEATIYLFPIAKKIIEKYKFKEFKYFKIKDTDEKRQIMYERMINQTLKEVCKKAGLDSEINFTEQIGDQLINKREPLYKLMHTHIARHTFVTLMCKMGVPKDIVIIATAHTDTKMIDEVYLHESPTEKGKKLIEAIKRNNSQSTFFKVHDSSETTVFLNNIFAYDLLLKLKKADEQGINIEELEERKEVISCIKRIPNIKVPSEIDKSFVDNSINEVFPTLLFIADTPTMILFIQKISRLDISSQINNSTEGDFIKVLQEIGSNTEYINQICSVWEKEKNKDHFKDRLFGIKKEDDRVISFEDSLKEIGDYVRKKITVE